MSKSFLLLVLVGLVVTSSYAQSISTASVSGTTFCAGVGFNVPYTITGTFSPGNIFSVQLSDSDGSFTTPISIGTLTSTDAGTITAIVPSIQGGGTGFRVRVLSSTPAVTGTDNGSDLTILPIGLNAPIITQTTLCPGQAISVNYTILNTCGFPNAPSNNIFTAQLSDALGSFSSPITIGNTLSNNSGTIISAIPISIGPGNNYRIRVESSNPGFVQVSPDNGTNLIINAFGISTPGFTETSFCQGQIFSIGYTVQNSCNYPNTPANNIFTAQLSNASGSFSAPSTIGSVTASGSGSIIANIGNVPASNLYRIRVVSSNPDTGVIGPDNGTNLIVYSSSGDPSIFGSTGWNAYVYKGIDFPIANNTFLGTYGEGNLSFDTRSRWASPDGPDAANAATGTSYTGCPLDGSNYSVSFKRTNFTCGYYEIDIPAHDDDVRLFVNGTLVFSHAPGCCDSHTNAYTGFLNVTTTVEFQFLNNGGSGYLQVDVKPAPNPLTISDPTQVCSTSNSILTVSSPLSLSYAWSPLTGLVPANGLGSSVVAPPTTTTYTATGTDAVTGCSVSKSVSVTLVPDATVPVILFTNELSTICSGITTSRLTANGANTYLWTPSTGLSSSSGTSVVANPSVTTTYTVTGSTGCQTGTNTTKVTVQVPGTPPATTFGDNTWNVYCHNNATLSNYYGYYTEDNLSFNTSLRWASGSGPSVANNSSGAAYLGCPFGGTNYSMSFKRSNFTCGYYQIDISHQDDALHLFVDGVDVFQNNLFTPSLQANIWTGFLGPTSTIELQLFNFTGDGRLQIEINPSPTPILTLSAPVTICAGTQTQLSSSSPIAGITNSWSVSPTDPSITLLPSSTVSKPIFQTSEATPAGDYTITQVLTDATNTNCTVTASVVVKVKPLSATAVLPATSSTSCPSTGIALTASGADTYSWSPVSGLDGSTGSSVIASPITTTTYTVTGSNSCSSNSATSTITINPLPDPYIFPMGTWNVYGFNSTAIGTNYQGYYTENGSGPSGLNFDTRARWSASNSPSSANTLNGNGWTGCPLPSNNISLSFKRTGFICGIYQLGIPAHDDDIRLLINGTQVALHQGCCDAHPNIWTGVLGPNSTVEWQLFEVVDDSYLQVSLTPVPQPTDLTVWMGGISSDWFNSLNWCNGVPHSTKDAYIPASGPKNFPLIDGTGASTRDITINPSLLAGTYTSFISPAHLTITGSNLDVTGNWINNGTFTSNTGTVSFVGTASGNFISTLDPQIFNDLIINKANGVQLSSGTHKIAGNLALKNGILKQNSSLIILNGGAVSDASDGSYVEGQISKVGSGTFTFPVGKAGLYRPIAISSPSLTTDSYSAQYFNGNTTDSYSTLLRSVTLNKVSNAEFWILNRNSGTSNVKITLSWGANSEVISDLSDLRVAGWNGSQWIDQGDVVTTGTIASGLITPETASDLYGPYTLATRVPTIEVGLLDFTPPGYTIFPNPSSGLTHINLNGESLYSLLIHDSKGKEITCRYLIKDSAIEINADSLAPGLYLVRIVTDKKSTTLKLVKQ